MSDNKTFVPLWERKKYLTKRQRVVLEMRNKNYSAEEIGSELGIKPETVYQTIHRAKGRNGE